MRVATLVGLGLLVGGCVFGADTSEVPDASAETDAGSDSGALPENPATITWDNCDEVARPIESIPAPTSQNYALRETSKYDLVSLEDSEGNYAVFWANALAQGAGKRVFIQLHRVELAAGQLTFPNDAQVEFDIPADDEIALLTALSGKKRVTGEVEAELLVATNQAVYTCVFPKPLAGEQCVEDLALKSLAAEAGVWPPKRVFSGANKRISNDTSAYLGFEGGTPLNVVGIEVEVAGGEVTRVAKLPVSGARGNTFPNSYGSYLWGFESEDGRPLFAAVLEPLDAADVPTASFITPTATGLNYDVDRAVALPSNVPLEAGKVTLGAAFTMKPLLNAGGLEAESARYGYVAIDENAGMMMGRVGGGTPFTFRAPEGDITKVVSSRDLDFLNRSNVEITMPTFFIWGGNKLAAGRVDLDGNGRFANNIVGGNVDEVLDVAVVDDLLLGRGLVAAQLKSGNVVELRLTPVDLSRTAQSYCAP